MTNGCTKTLRGFSLVELAIVLAVIGAMISGIWSYAASVKQNARVDQAIEAVARIAEGTRGAYGGQSAIFGGVSTVVPALAQRNAAPPDLLRSTATVCSGISGNYIDTPWSSGGDACGTLHVCAWAYGTNTTCASPGNTQFFGIEFTQLDYGSCVELSQGVVPARTRGLTDVYINGNSVEAAGTGLPVSSTTASGKCTAHSNANIVDFIYTLRTPLS